MHSLERECGTALFYRTNRGMILTSAGHALLGSTRRILRDIRQAEAAVSADPRRRTPRLDLAAVEFALNGPFADVVAAFVRAHQDTVVNVHELGSDRDAIEMLASGEAEVVATRLPLNVGRAGEHVATLPLGSYDVFVAYQPGTGEDAEQLDSARSIDPAQLRDMPLVVTPPGSDLSPTMEAMIDEITPHLRRQAVVGQRETRTAWMLEGIAATLVGARPAALAASLGARLVPLRGAAEFTVGLVWDPRSLSPVGRLFVAEAAAQVVARSPAAPAPPAQDRPAGTPPRSAGTAGDPAT